MSKVVISTLVTQILKYNNVQITASVEIILFYEMKACIVFKTHIEP